MASRLRASHRENLLRRGFRALWIGSVLCFSFPTTNAALVKGLELAFFQPGSTVPLDATVWPALGLYVPATESPTPFAGPGRFEAQWRGFLSLDLRDEFEFKAEFKGGFHFAINGTPVFEGITNNSGLWSKPIRLNKGTNSLSATFESPAQGDAFLRLEWRPRGKFAEPIPASALSCDPLTPELELGQQQRLGRGLFLERRCIRCHTSPALRNGELQMDAPSFEGIGSRRNAEWLARWILDPTALRPNARMPRLFHGARAQAQASDAAAFLASLQTPAPAGTNSASGSEEGGKRLFDALHCAACHPAPGEKGDDRERVSLDAVALKFPAGRLEEFLQRPEAHYEWIRMPNFHLSPADAANLAAFLARGPGKAERPPPDPQQAARGRKIVQTSGCLNCHALKLDNAFQTIPLIRIGHQAWSRGCLSDTPHLESTAPEFSFSARERAALALFAKDPGTSLELEVATEFAEREIKLLRCQECHGKFDGFPPLDRVGGKLQPEWCRAFMAGDLPEKPRPWIEARMPAFPKYAAGIAQGLTMQQGLPPHTPPTPPPDPNAAAIGRKLAGAEGGLSCVSCHAVGSFKATQVFENAGINFAMIGARLYKNYFERWVRNPAAIDPVTKMPMFFDEELHSPLVEIYDGDGAKQIEALWQYIRLGEHMPVPGPGAPP